MNLTRKSDKDVEYVRAVPGPIRSHKPVKSLIEKYNPADHTFGFNISNKNDTARFINDMQKSPWILQAFPFHFYRPGGRRVFRILDGITQFPGAMATGAADDKDLTYKAAMALGMQLRLMGVNMNLTPVLDVNNNPNNPVINTRSFGSNPLSVAYLGVAYILGLQRAMCIAVGKHFPGHGDTNDDSHFTLPVISYNLDRLRSIEFLPFIEAIKNGVECIMTAHIAYPSIMQNKEPATVSKLFLTDILRTEMKFEG